MHTIKRTTKGKSIIHLINDQVNRFRARHRGKSPKRLHLSYSALKRLRVEWPDASAFKTRSGRVGGLSINKLHVDFILVLVS